MVYSEVFPSFLPELQKIESCRVIAEYKTLEEESRWPNSFADYTQTGGLGHFHLSFLKCCI